MLEVMRSQIEGKVSAERQVVSTCTGTKNQLGQNEHRYTGSQVVYRSTEKIPKAKLKLHIQVETTFQFGDLVSLVRVDVWLVELRVIADEAWNSGSRL